MSFEARLLRDDLTDCSLHALWCCSEAFETARYNDAPPDLTLNVALDWLEISGEKLHQNHEDFGVHGRGGSDSDEYRSSDVWRGFPGFCGERWCLWAGRLLGIAWSESFDEELRRRAGVVAEAILARQTAPSTTSDGSQE